MKSLLPILVILLPILGCATTQTHVPTMCCPEKRGECWGYYRHVNDPRRPEKHRCVEVERKEIER